jgi:hypothetical protein
MVLTCQRGISTIRFLPHKPHLIASRRTGCAAGEPSLRLAPQRANWSCKSSGAVSVSSINLKNSSCTWLAPRMILDAEPQFEFGSSRQS